MSHTLISKQGLTGSPPPNPYVEVFTLVSSELDCIWRWGLYKEVIESKWGYDPIRVGSYKKRGWGHRHTQRHTT